MLTCCSIYPPPSRTLEYTVDSVLLLLPTAARVYAPSVCELGRRLSPSNLLSRVAPRGSPRLELKLQVRRLTRGRHHSRGWTAPRAPRASAAHGARMKQTSTTKTALRLLSLIARDIRPLATHRPLGAERTARRRHFTAGELSCGVPTHAAHREGDRASDRLHAVRPCSNRPRCAPLHANAYATRRGPTKKGASGARFRAQGGARRRVRTVRDRAI